MGYYGNIVLAAIFQETKLDRSVDQVISNLVRDDLVFPHCPLRPLEIAHEEITDSNKPDFAAIHELFHRSHGFFNGNCVVGPMQLIEIDVICVQALQTRIGRCSDISGPEMSGGYLCRKKDVFANSSNRLTYDLLGAVRFGGVDETRSECDARSKRCNPPAILPSSKSDDRQLRARG